MANSKNLTQKQLQELGEALDNHIWNNRKEIEVSEICMCTECYFRFPPSAVTRWQDDVSAVCPNPDCLSGGAVIGSASGLNFGDYDCTIHEQQ